ncbi:MAG: hypothetical protein U0L17_03740 [Acutalibacteraceae bacterium]|nr:hypothetical protein [Acutalibacteraceae bacterium]
MKRIIATVLTFLYVVFLSVVFLNIGANAQTADVLKASLISSSVSGMPYQTLKIKIEYIITNQKGTDFSIKTKSNSKVVFDGADTIYPKPKTDDFGICTWEGRKAYAYINIHTIGKTDEKITVLSYNNVVGKVRVKTCDTKDIAKKVKINNSVTIGKDCVENESFLKQKFKNSENPNFKILHQINNNKIVSAEKKYIAVSSVNYKGQKKLYGKSAGSTYAKIYFCTYKKGGKIKDKIYLGKTKITVKNKDSALSVKKINLSSAQYKFSDLKKIKYLTEPKVDCRMNNAYSRNFKSCLYPVKSVAGGNLYGIIKNYHRNSVYSMTSSNSKCVCVYKKTMIQGVKKGSSKITVYEKKGKTAKKQKIGTCYVSVTDNKRITASEFLKTADYYMDMETDGMKWFSAYGADENLYLKKDISVDIGSIVNTAFKAINIEPVKISYKTNYPEYFNLTENGVITAKTDELQDKVQYYDYRTIAVAEFSDGSKYTWVFYNYSMSD